MRLRLYGLMILAVVCTVILAACDQSYQNIPPNYIGMKLTPTGYEETIYTPGQVDIGTTSQAGQGNQLVLIQRSGVEVKEQFLGKEGNKDGADYRCLTQDQNPMTLDVRLVLALPDYSTPQGKKDLRTLFMLGNPTQMQGNNRILMLSAESVYVQQAQLQVRGHIRKICSQYPDFGTAFKSFSAERDNLTDRIAAGVGKVLIEQGVPLRLVGAQVSNMKPDESVVEAQVAQKAAEARTAAIKTLTDFLDQDPTGTRKMVYRMQVLQELTRTANANGHNTIFLTDLNGPSASVLPLSTGH
jgi:SPFH domain / Band 7 family